MASGSSSSSSSSSFRRNPNVPIPNNPFYYPETSFLQGDLGQLIVGSGLNIDYAAGTISASGGGGGGAVNQVTGGTGISVSPTTGNVVVNNTGVLQITGGTGITITGTKTNYTISTPFNGTVTAITAGVGLTGGIITSTGTLAVDGNVVLLRSLFTAKGQLLASTAAANVAPLSSSGFPNGYVLTIDATAPTGLKWDAIPTAVQTVNASAPIQSTGGLNPVISVSNATTGNSGVTTLVDDLTTNDPTKALTAAQGYALQQQLSSLAAAGGLTLAGTLNAATGNLVTVTTSGSSKGFAVGSPIPAPAAGNADYFVIVTTPGTYDPPGPGGPYTATQGDWFNSTGTAWDYLNVGFDAPSATTTVAGIVCLSTNALAQAGTDTTTALTPAAATSAFVPLSSLTAKGTLVTATALGAVSSLGVGADGQILTACGTAPNGLCWASAGAAGIPCGCITGKGAIISGSAANNPVALSVGTDGQVLIACAACPVGLTWGTLSLPYIPCSAITAKGDLITGPSAGTPTALPVGTNGQILSADSAAGNGLVWCTPEYIPCSIVTAKGGVIGGSAAGTPVYQAPAAGNNCMLISCSTNASGLAWVCRPQPATSFDNGLVKGCTTGTNATFGDNYGIFVNTFGGQCMTLVGQAAGYNGAISSCGDTLVGYGVISGLGCYTTGGLNVGVGMCTMAQMRGSSFMNTALGACIHSSGCMQGCNNVIIGAGVTLPNPTGSRQLAIGFNPYNFPSSVNYWLTGCCDKTIQLGAGLRDCNGNVGFPQSVTDFQVLSSQGASGVTWEFLPPASTQRAGVVLGLDSGYGLILGGGAGTGFGGNFTRFACATVVGNQSTQYVFDATESVFLGYGIGQQDPGGTATTTQSVFVGACSGAFPRNAAFNTAVGYCSGFNVGAGCNTFLGACAGGSVTQLTGTNNTAIGFGSSPATAASNTVTLGNAAITSIRAAVTSITSLSDARDKDNIRALPLGIGFLRDVQPVQFTWKQREGNPVKDGTEEAGFIAQQLKEVQEKHSAQFLGLVDETDPNRLEASPGKLLPILVKAIQELADAHEKLRNDFDSYKATHP